MIQTGLFSLLSGISQISSLVGSRIYPVTLPEAVALPALTYQFVGGSSTPTFETSGMQKLRIQFDAWGTNYDDAANLRDVLIAQINGYQGLLSDGTFLQNVDQIQSNDFFEDAPRQYRCMAEFYLYFDNQ